MSSVTFTREASQEDFVAKLEAIHTAVKESGQRVTDKLEITSTNTFCYGLRRIGYPFADTFSTFRTHNVAASLLEYCKANKKFTNLDIITNKAKEIVLALNTKTHSRYGEGVASTLYGLETFEYPVEGSDTSTLENQNKDGELKSTGKDEVSNEITGSETDTLIAVKELEIKENDQQTGSDNNNTNVQQPPLVPYEDDTNENVGEIANNQANVTPTETNNVDNV